MTVEMPPGPPCDVCEDEPAVLSLLNYADYQQLKLGANCAPDVMRGIADGMDGRQTAGSGGESDAGPHAGEESQAGTTGAPESVLPDDGSEEGSARDHWASTTNVRRSTHGHRSPRGATGKPREEVPE